MPRLTLDLGATVMRHLRQHLASASVLLVLVGLAVPATLPAGEPPQQLWAATFDGGGTPFATDVLYDMAVNAAGETCATGGSVTTGGAFAAATVLYDSDGSERWRRFFAGPQTGGNDSGRRVFLTADGTCVVAGHVSSSETLGLDVLVLAYDPTGLLLWDASHDEASGLDLPVDVTVDGAGNVLVAAQSNGAGNGWDLLLLKLDADGNELWSRTYDGPISGDDEPAGVAVDADGNVYLAGTAAVLNQFGDDLVLIKYDADGNELWTETHDGGVGGTDLAAALELDAAGHPYVAGLLLAPPGTEWQAAIVKFLPSGVPDWTGLAGHPSPGIPEDVRGLAVDAAGAYLVAEGSDDVLVARFDLAGTPLWDHLHDSVSLGDLVSRPLAVDAAGNAYVAAYDFVPGMGFEFLTYRLEAADGALGWERTYGEVGDTTNDFAAAVQLDARGNILAGGTVQPGGVTFENDWAVVKYDGSGLFADGFESGDLSAWTSSSP